MTTTQKPADMAFAVHPRPSQRAFAAKSPSSCIDCKPASDCAEPTCSATSTLTPQCTDQCVVIACDDPDHPAAVCSGQGKDARCNFVCDNTMNCEDCHNLDVFVSRLVCRWDSADARLAPMLQRRTSVRCAPAGCSDFLAEWRLELAFADG